MTCIGAPGVYYGDEAGMWGADDPDDRKPMLWPDMQYADEVSHPFGKSRPADTNTFNKDLFQYYRSLIHLRQEHRALSLGESRTIITDDERDIYSFLRTHNGEEILVVLNNNTTLQNITIPSGDPVSSKDWATLFASPGVQTRDGGRSFTIPPKSGLVLKAEED